MGEQRPSLLLVFTMGMSLTGWEKVGILDRELKVYEQLLDKNILDKIYLLTYSAKDSILENKIHPKIKVLQKPRFFSFPAGDFFYSFLAGYIHKKKLMAIDLIKTNQMWGSWTAVFIKKSIKKPLIIRSGYTLSKNARKAISRWLYEKIEAFAYSHCDQAVVTSEHDLNYVREKYHPGSISIIPNYIDTELFKPLNSIKNKDLVYVGRLSVEKNLEYTIELIAKSGLSLDIYGSGPLKDSLQAKIKQLGASNKITLRGKVANSQLPKIYNSYRAYIQLSEYEGAPKTILEAMSCGLPVIGSNVRGINEVVRDQTNGILLDISKPVRPEVISRLLGDQTSLKMLGSNARKLIGEKYSLAKIVDLEKTLISNISRGAS